MKMTKKEKLLAAIKKIGVREFTPAEAAKLAKLERSFTNTYLWRMWQAGKLGSSGRGVYYKI